MSLTPTRAPQRGGRVAGSAPQLPGLLEDSLLAGPRAFVREEGADPLLDGGDPIEHARQFFDESRLPGIDPVVHLEE